jgi:hypothetical protein
MFMLVFEEADFTIRKAIGESHMAGPPSRLHHCDAAAGWLT